VRSAIRAVRITRKRVRGRSFCKGEARDGGASEPSPFRVGLWGVDDGGVSDMGGVIAEIWSGVNDG